MPVLEQHLLGLVTPAIELGLQILRDRSAQFAFAPGIFRAERLEFMLRGFGVEYLARRARRLVGGEHGGWG